MSLYKCTYHNLDLLCIGCIKAWIARHDRMLEFIKKFATEKEGDFSLCNDDAIELLKELGLNENKDSE